VTLRFFPYSQEDTCSYNTSGDALTFTTASIPIIGHCFNLVDLFGGNTTRGFVNETDNLLNPPRSQQVGISWQLENVDKYNPQANYSKVLYRQHLDHASDERYEPGSYSFRRINIYGGPNCTEINPLGDNLLDWYGFDCFSEDGGSCGRTPYSISSFYVRAGYFEDESQQHGKCMVFARMGAAAGHQLSKAVAGALLCASIAVLMVW
jgi:hypothetical protein